MIRSSICRQLRGVLATREFVDALVRQGIAQDGTLCELHRVVIKKDADGQDTFGYALLFPEGAEGLELRNQIISRFDWEEYKTSIWGTDDALHCDL